MGCGDPVHTLLRAIFTVLVKEFDPVPVTLTYFDGLPVIEKAISTVALP
jgi:hypothetical protein